MFEKLKIKIELFIMYNNLIMAAMASNDCPICCESFNSSTRLKVVCVNQECGLEACKSCIRTYLLGITNDPCCMNCKTAFNQEFLTSNLNQSFCKKEYKEHRRNMLLERELGKMPESMAAAETQKNIDLFTEEGIKISKEIAIAVEKVNRLKEKNNNNMRRIWRLKNGRVKSEKKKFIMPCSVKDCRGFLSTAYKCELCEIYTCPECLTPIGENRINNLHVCDPATVENAKFIKETCKACPGMCGEFIFKIDGCDQMWCTTCHTAFSWKTGAIETGVVHNPHYYAALQEGGGMVPRAPGDVVCGGLPDFFNDFDRPFKQVMRKIMRNIKLEGDETLAFYNTFDKIEKTRPKKDKFWSYMYESARKIYLDVEYKKLISYKSNYTVLSTYLLVEIIYKELQHFHRNIQHVNIVTLNDEREKLERYRNSEDHRVNYLLKKISKDELGDMVYKDDIKRQKIQEEIYIWELFSACGIDFFRDLSNKLSELNRANIYYFDEVHEILNYINTKTIEFMKLCDYCNNEFKKIGVTYGLVVPYLDIYPLNCEMIRRGVYRLHNYHEEQSNIEKISCKDVDLLLRLFTKGISYYNSYNYMNITTKKYTKKSASVRSTNIMIRQMITS